MGKTCGKAFCGTLSYDFAFMAIIRMALEGNKPEFEKKRCMAHPFRKRNSVKDNESLRYCSAAAALLGYGKCKDDICDERGFSRLKARLALPFFKRARKKALKKIPGLSELDLRIKSHLDALAAIEKDTESAPSADRPAEVFGKIVSDILSFGLEGAQAKMGAALGKAVGHWIYLVDAADDYDGDKKKNRYNPFMLLFEGKDFDRDKRTQVKEALISILIDAEKALDLFDFSVSREFYEITRNILYLGMPEVADRILGLACDEKTVKKRKNRKDDLQYG
jgi:hypothetical protein